MKIMINGKELVTEYKEMSYENLVVSLGYRSCDILSATYESPKSKDGWEKSGSLIPGTSVELMEGMIFNCYDTSNA